MKKNDVMKGWFVVRIHFNYGKKVKCALEKMIVRRNLSDKIFRIVIPSQKEMNSYMFVNMLPVPEALAAILHMENVYHFLGSDSDPQPLTADEVRRML